MPEMQLPAQYPLLMPLGEAGNCYGGGYITIHPGQLLPQAENRIREFFLILLDLLQQFGLIPVMIADRVVQSLLQIRYLILQFSGLGVDFTVQFLTEIVQLAGQFLLKNGGIVTGAIPADHQNTLRLGNHVFFAFSIKGDAVSSFLQNKSPIQHTLRLFACVFIFIVVNWKKAARSWRRRSPGSSSSSQLRPKNSTRPASVAPCRWSSNRSSTNSTKPAKGCANDMNPRKSRYSQTTSPC